MDVYYDYNQGINVPGIIYYMSISDQDDVKRSKTYYWVFATTSKIQISSSKIIKSTKNHDTMIDGTCDLYMDINGVDVVFSYDYYENVLKHGKHDTLLVLANYDLANSDLRQI